MFFKNNLLSYVQISLYFLPVSLIVGSLVVNINLIIFILLGAIYIIKNTLKIKFDSINVSLFLFFVTLIVSSFFNFEIIGLENFIKSIFLLKFFLLYLVLDTLLKNNKINLKNFFKVCLILTFFVSIDVIIQFIFGKNILGFVPHEGRIAGIFGAEAIAGAFIQKFFIFSLLGIFLIEHHKKKQFKLFELLFFIIIIFASFVASNRMSFLMLLSLVLVLLIFYKVFRKNLIIALIMLIPLFSLLYKSETSLNLKFQDYKVKTEILIENSIETLSNEDYNLKKRTFSTNHGKIFITSIRSFSENKIIGGGLKSFRFQCFKLEKNESTLCSTHPHNYHLEILHDTGIIGFILLILFAIQILVSKYKEIRVKNLMYNDKILISLLTLNFLIEIFPLKSTGSLFSTWTGTILWLSLALLNYRGKSNEKK